MENLLEVKNLTKLFGRNLPAALKMQKEGAGKEEIFKKLGATVAIDNVSFTVKQNEIFAIIGLSGSGKSTVVRCLNMLCRPTSGQILFEGRDIAGFSKRELIHFRRECASMVFQQFGLFNHRDILNNVVFGLEVRGMKKQQREERGMEMIRMVGLEGWERYPVDSLSGGMRQRVGIARALANDPQLLLMDEPFSALDPIVRRDMQFELLNIQKSIQKTIVFITHDINEAFKLGDRVAVMKDGRIVQTGTPEEILTCPADSYVEEFVKDIDKAKVLTVGKVMQLPSAFIRPADGPNVAMKVMRDSGVSSVYVVDNGMELIGILTLDSALRVRAGELSLKDALLRDIPETSEESLLSELMPIAAGARFPIAVIDEKHHLKGIVTKASVLSSLSS